uniref:Uncharacterized protein n=1 Tax=Rhizophora mucronata TaxID=61149 RepID=A0A2P2QCM6_RHIMU
MRSTSFPAIAFNRPCYLQRKITDILNWLKKSGLCGSSYLLIQVLSSPYCML